MGFLFAADIENIIHEVLDRRQELCITAVQILGVLEEARSTDDIEERDVGLIEHVKFAGSCNFVDDEVFQFLY